MNRIVAFAAALTTSALLFLATTTPALAQGSTGYTLVPATAPASSEALVSSEAVSYTHLDVYKRQDQGMEYWNVPPCCLFWAWKD